MSSDPDAKKPDADPPSAPAEPTRTREPSIPIDVSTGASGSIEVALSGPFTASDGTPASMPSLESEPVSRGKVKAVAAGGEPTRGSNRRITEGVKEAIEGAIGDGMSAIGSGLGTLGEGVSKLGERSHVPIVGPGISKIGEGISSVGDTLTTLPRVAKTRRGRLLLRSMLVSFLLVFAWIAVIVALQVRGIDAPDFRPSAERVLIALSGGSAAIEQLYDQSSPRFQEVVRKDRFVDDMLDMQATVGKFVEIAAVNDSFVTNGPSGRIGRASLTVTYDKGTAKASVSLHFDQDKWKLLGVNVEVPPELRITQAQREQRVQACKDPMDPKKCDLFVAANHVLEQLRDGHADAVWDGATRIFQQQEEKARFVSLQRDAAAALGEYRRIIAVAEAKVYTNGTIGTFDVLTEYARSQGVRATFGFYRGSKAAPWKLRSLKVVLPMPRADENLPLMTIEPAGPARPPAPRPADPRPTPPVRDKVMRVGSGSAVKPSEGSGSAAPAEGSGSAAPADGSAAPNVGSAAGSPVPEPATGSGSSVSP